MPKSVFTGDHEVLVAVMREARMAAGLTQTQLAERLGRDQTTISLIENRQRRVDVVEFCRFAEAIEVEPLKLLAAFLDRRDRA